jgi:hypothetical protein
MRYSQHYQPASTPIHIGEVVKIFAGKTLEEVGQQFSVTRERIRQIEAKALRKHLSKDNRHKNATGV